MKDKLHRISVPAAVFLFFVVLTLFGNVSSHFFVKLTSHNFYIVYNYVVQVAMVLSGMFLINRIMNIAVWDGLVSRMLGTSVPRLIKDLFATLFLIIGVTIIIGAVFKQPVTGIVVTSSTIGIVLGFALRSLILDVFTGIAINVDGSYKIGDWIHLHARNEVEYIGCIIEMNWRTIRLKTTANNIIVVPNSVMGLSVVTNFSEPESLSRFELHFELDFSVPSERAMRILLASMHGAIGYEGIEAEPEPTVKISAVTEKGVDYMVRYWIYPAKTSPSRARHVVISSVLQNLRTAGISLAYPKQDIFHASMPARDLDVRVKEDTVKILASVDLFRFVPPAALDMLAEHVKTVTFHAPEKVVVMGTEGDAMYVIVEGFLDVYIYSEAEKKDVRIGTLSASEFFGEMALLTGKPRSATVIAATEVVAYEITREAMMPLVNTYPEILETISRVTAERQLRERYFLENMHEKEVTKETQNLTDEILTGIMNFFGLVRDTVTHRRREN